MARRRQIYEGKAKTLYEGPEPGTIVQYFKDEKVFMRKKFEIKDLSQISVAASPFDDSLAMAISFLQTVMHVDDEPFVEKTKHIALNMRAMSLVFLRSL